MKKTKLETRKRMFTILAKGGAPAGYNCPNKTIEFNMIRTIIVCFLYFFIVVF